MNLFTRKMRMFCVSNIMVSFVCTGFLGINGYNKIESPRENAHEISLTASDTEPLSQNGKDEKRLADVNTIVGDSSSSKKSKTTTNVVTKKEVKKTVTYAPAEYSSVTGDAIVSYAKRFLGLRYKTGTPSLTNGADCSGFTMLIYREFGVSLPRTVSGQTGRGTYVNKKDLQKGDLVFYKNKGASGGASHVAIYIGGGQVIHESRPGVGVKISPVNMMQYVTARRVINSKAKQIAEQKLEEENKNNEVVADTPSNDVSNNDTNTVTDNNTNNNNNNNNNNVVNNNTVVENTNTTTETNTTTSTSTPVETPKEESNPTSEEKTSQE